MRPVRSRIRSVPKTPSRGLNGNESKMQDPVEVFCRIKPLADPSDTACISLYSSTKVGFPPDILKNRKLLQYTFSHVFTEHADQREIFDHIAMPLLYGFIKGENGLLFSYGVTGSGKTHTMSGEPNNPGIVPRCVNTIFNSIGSNQTPKYLIKSDKLNGFEVQSESEALMERLQEAKMKRKATKKTTSDTDNHAFINEGRSLDEIDDNFMYTVFITYVEIYNNSAYDLLDENAGSRSLQSKILREDCRRNVYINGVIELEVKSAEEALELYLLGNQRKRMGTTSLNAESSRSHSIFTIRLVISPDRSSDISEKSSLIISQLSLVDLAGSERCSRTNTKGARLKEAGSINNSLMSLRTCLEILRENQQTNQNKIIPYRDSRLTHLFKNYFEGEGKVKMIVCVNPSLKDLDETMHVMKFAEMTQEVKIARPETKIGDPVEKRDKALRMIDELQAIRAQFQEHRGPVPKVTRINPDSEEIKTLILYLKRRRETITSAKAIRRLSDKFRMRLVHVQDAKDKYDKEVKFLLPAERTKVKELKNKLVETGVKLDKVVEHCMEKDKLIGELQATIDEKDFKIRQNVLDKQKQKRKIEQVSEKMTHELDGKLRRQREYYATVMQEQNNKIELVKDILHDKVPPEIKKAAGEPVVVEMEPDENIAPSTPTTKLQERASYGHIPRRETPVSNSRFRRSRSAGHVWLEHKPAMPVPTGTVLQPNIVTRKSVSKLTNMKDVIDPKQSRYLLVSQNATDDGELETKYYKGDIIPTCSGGAQIIFDDVEKLSQESPLKSDTDKKVTLRRTHPTVTEERCAVSIEGHSAKKVKK